MAIYNILTHSFVGYLHTVLLREPFLKDSLSLLLLFRVLDTVQKQRESKNVNVFDGHRKMWKKHWKIDVEIGVKKSTVPYVGRVLCGTVFLTV